MKRLSAVARAAAVLSLLVLCPGPALAGPMQLTQTASNQGFTLTTFASGFAARSDGLGPLGMAFLSGGRVLVTDDLGSVYLFPSNTDNQALPAPEATYGFNDAGGLATIGSHIYMTQPSTGRLVEINADGSINHAIASFTNPVAVISNPLNPGHVFIDQYSIAAITDVNTATGASHVVLPVIADGIDFDAATNTMYAATVFDGVRTTAVQGYNLTTGIPVFPSPIVIPGFPDGIALGRGSLAGNLFANTNGGDLVEINIATGTTTLIGTGGTRGDFVSVDPNGTLLITQQDRILRLTAPAGGGFGDGGGNAIPEPASIWLLITGILAVAARYHRRLAPGTAIQNRSP
jgi:hypothetical protein